MALPSTNDFSIFSRISFFHAEGEALSEIHNLNQESDFMNSNQTLARATKTSVKFTSRFLDQLQPALKKEQEYSDSSLSGFKAVVNAKGSVSFLLRYSFLKKKRAIKIGNYPVVGLQEARQKALEFKRLLANGIDPQQQRDLINAMPTFDTFVAEHYLPRALSRKRSYPDDVSKISIHMLPVFGHKRMNEITSQDVETYLSGLLTQSGLQKSTANRHRALLSVIFTVAIERGFISKNPCTHVKKFIENNLIDRFLSNDELGRLMEVLNDQNPDTRESNQTVIAVIKLLLLTGVRRQEALNMRWEHVDLDHRTWLLPVTKSGKRRRVQLNTEAWALLKSLPNCGEQGDVFITARTGKQINDPSRAFKRIMARAGIKDFRIHDLRHNYASMAVNSGASLYVVQHLLGHASSATTMRYSHLSNETLMAASQQVGNMVSLNSPAI